MEVAGQRQPCLPLAHLHRSVLQDPANLGNPLLKPESARSFEGGPEWNLGGRVSAEATVFHRQERNDIDYVRSSRPTLAGDQHRQPKFHWGRSRVALPLAQIATA